MIEAIITLLIYICVIALVIYLVIWVLQTVAGIVLPAQVIKILWVIFALICVLLLARLLLSSSGRLRLSVLDLLPYAV